MASSWSSSGSSRLSTGNRDFSSPIRYRHHPYESVVHCLCGRKAAGWLSWSDDNLGRRYLKYFCARAGGSGFWKWFDKYHISSFIRELLIDLHDTVKIENKQLKSYLFDATTKLEEKKSEKEELSKELCEKNAANVALMGRVQKLEHERMMLMVVVVCCVGVLLGMMFSK